MSLPYPPAALLGLSSSIFTSDLVLKPNSYSTHLCPKLLTNSKSVFAKIWNAPLHLNHALNGFPQSLWSVFFSSPILLILDLVIRNLLLELHAQSLDKTLFLRNPQFASFLSPKVMHCSFCLVMALYIISYTGFGLGRSCILHYSLRWPCTYLAPPMHAHLVLFIMFKLKRASLLLFIINLSFGLSLMVQLQG